MDNKTIGSESKSMAKPCRHCGSVPALKTANLPGVGQISRMVYPCSCYDQDDRRRAEAETWQAKLGRAKIPPRYHSANFQYAKLSPYDFCFIPHCEEYIKKYYNGGPGMGFLGDVGVGKTYYICAIIIELMHKGKQCLFLNVPEYYDELKHSFNESSASDSEQLTNAAKESKIVAFDDIGAEYTTHWTVDELGKIINYRYNHNLTTLFTSNLRANELGERIGKRTVDRLREMCQVYLVEGESIRKRNK